MIIDTPSQRQTEWYRRMDQLDYEAQMATARAEGLAEGIAKERAEGEKLFADLITKLFALGRIEDIQKAVMDEKYMDKLFAEFGMAE